MKGIGKRLSAICLLLITCSCGCVQNVTQAEPTQTATLLEEIVTPIPTPNVTPKPTPTPVPDFNNPEDVFNDDIVQLAASKQIKNLDAADLIGEVHGLSLSDVEESIRWGNDGKPLNPSEASLEELINKWNVIRKNELMLIARDYADIVELPNEVHLLNNSYLYAKSGMAIDFYQKLYQLKSDLFETRNNKEEFVMIAKECAEFILYVQGYFGDLEEPNINSMNSAGEKVFLINEFLSFYDVLGSLDSETDINLVLDYPVEHKAYPKTFRIKDSYDKTSDLYIDEYGKLFNQLIENAKSNIL